MLKAVILILCLINHAHPRRSLTNPCPQFMPPAPWLCTGEAKVFYIGKVKCYGPPEIIPCNDPTTFYMRSNNPDYNITEELSNICALNTSYIKSTTGVKGSTCPFELPNTVPVFGGTRVFCKFCMKSDYPLTNNSCQFDRCYDLV